MGSVVGFALAMLTTATPSTASDPTTVRLSWDAPPACPSEASVAEDLSRLTRGAVATAAAAELDVRAFVVEGAGGFTLELEITAGDRHEVRQLASERCETLAHAATLMIAVAVAPVATATTVRSIAIVPPPTPVTEAGEVAPVRRAARPADVRSSTSSRRAWTHRFVLSAWAGPSIATLPRVSAILGGDLGWRFGPLGLQLSGWHTFAARDAIASGVGVRAALSGGSARFVYAPRAGPVELPLSLGVELGAMLGRGTGSRVRPQDVRTLWSALAIGVGVAWPARTRIALAVKADALVSLVRPGIHLETVDGPVPAFRMPPVGLRVLAGAMVRLP